MTKQRTDTERLDWLEKTNRDLWKYEEPYKAGWRVSEAGDLEPFAAPTPREAIDSAMDAAESAQMDEAWKALRADPEGSIELVVVPDKELDAGPEFWQAIINGIDASAAERDTAVLAAYLVSKGK